MSEVLVDTHALIYFAERSLLLTSEAKARIDDAATKQFVSAASIWEMAIKIQLGKLTLKSGSLREFVGMLRANRFEILPVSADDAIGVGDLPSGEHKDPFDRIIAAQCLRLDLTLVSADTAFDACGVRRLW